MDDEVTVRVGDGITDLEKQLQAFGNPELASVAVGIELHAVHVFHDEVRLAAVT